MPALTQHQKIIAIMCINQQQRWWKPQDIMKAGQDKFFVGYEASARLSELGSEYPDMIESKREGKFMLRRLRFETGKEWYKDLPKDLQQMFKNYYQKAGQPV